ncbi:MAG: 1-deoxy-D-xylulose-5-phosphate reductoisomerase [Sedimentisphaerales bacterium]|nr:1-deoxy-D-xylulose-5-phosphate reductoisomerase [Sedimentisphaerales bacterium]
MEKKIAILGSTGSIGTNALRVIESLGPEYQVFALSAHSNIELLAQQAKKYKPDFIAVTNPRFAQELHDLIGDLDVEILSGPEGLVQIAQLDDIDIVLAAVVGSAGLPALLAAAEKGKKLAIANKEPLVIAGQLLLEKTKKNGGSIIPVDSEHSAVFQAMQSGKHEEVHKIILTASGGPFRKFSLEDIENATLEQALVHPVWDMGPKITIDSATMMNKAFEVIEARWLFDMPSEKLDVLIHPESIIHSLVEFVDGSIIAQMGVPDMCLPIQYALTYPNRVPGISRRLRLEEVGSLTFHKPNMEIFRALRLGFEVARIGGTTAVVFNAANEAAVEEFMAGRIKFVNIVELIEYCLNKHSNKNNVSLEELLETDIWARKQVKKYLQSGNKSII